MITYESEQRKRIRTYPVVSAKAIQLGFAGPMRLYELVQSLASSHNGCPYFSRATLIRLNLLEAQQIDRALRDGLGLFWNRTFNGDYHMISRAKVIQALELEGKPGRAVWLPIEAFMGRLVNYKANIHAGYLAQRYQTAPSRDFLCELFGVTVPTLIEWERRTKVNVRPRIVMVDPTTLDGATGDQGQLVAVWKEWTANATSRVWITVRGPRGGQIAGRRLMDNKNRKLDDYWRVMQEPTWENDGIPVLTWQETNEYGSPLDMCISGRGSWLYADVNRLDTPDTNAMGGHANGGLDKAPDHNRTSWKTTPGWHYDLYKALKWQGRKPNRSRPAIVQKVYKHHIRGEWLPSRSAQWNEK